MRSRVQVSLSLHAEITPTKVSASSSGCSSARLEYTSGGRVVAGSNPVIPTNRKALIFSRISRLFLFITTPFPPSVEHKWNMDCRNLVDSHFLAVNVLLLIYFSPYNSLEPTDSKFYRVGCYGSV